MADLRTHAMAPELVHDENAALSFVVDLKAHLGMVVEPRLKALAATVEADDYHAARHALEKKRLWQGWANLMRAAQEQMWAAAGATIDRQLDALVARAATIQGGSVTLDPALEVPRYMASVDTHVMPGSYYADSRPDDVRQGAVFDLAAAIYHQGRNGGNLNDVRGHTIAAHLFERFSDVQPRRLLEMGCTVGHSSVALAGYFPDADYVAIDIGAPVLRYARARAAALGRSIDFCQANAEATGFADASFDVVCSAVMLHETSHRALSRIMAESFRLLRSGGVAIHLEVPVPYDAIDRWAILRSEFETHYNNEPFWRGCNTTDLVAAMRAAGFVDVERGYQNAVAGDARRATPGYSLQPGTVYGCWLTLSGRRP